MESKLKERRKASGMSQKALAEASGLSFRTIQDWERWGTDRARVGQLRKAAAALRCDMADLIG